MQFNVAAASALDIEIKKYLAVKYGLKGCDEQGLGLYEVPPGDWQDDDLEFAQRWDGWVNGKTYKTQQDLQDWYAIAFDKGVRVSGPLVPKAKGFPFGKIAIGIGAALFARWIMSPPVSIMDQEKDQKFDEDSVRRALSLSDMSSSWSVGDQRPTRRLPPMQPTPSSQKPIDDEKVPEGMVAVEFDDAEFSR